MKKFFKLFCLFLLTVSITNAGNIFKASGVNQERSLVGANISLPGNNPQISFAPVIRPNGDGSITVPGKDGVFDEHGDNDYRVQGPGITFDPVNGNVSLPNGGTVTKPGGQQETVPNGTIVLPDGTIIQPSPEMNHIPVITIKSSSDYTYDETNKTITIKQNTPFDAATIATANDVEDGDITNKLVINVTRTRQTVNGSVDTSIAPSEWKVEYSVTDSKGATARKNITVIVQKIELPGNDGELGDPNNPNDPDREDNPVVNPGGPNKPITKPDGGVELPDGGDIEYPFNPDNPGGSITVPPGSVVNPDGSVETPEGGQVGTDEDGTITLPGQDDELGTDDDVVVKPGGNGDATINPDGSVTVPGGGEITFPNKPDHNGTITIPGDSTVKPDGTVETPGGDVVRPNPDGTIQLPGQDDELGTDDDVIVKPGGNGDATIKPDGSVDIPNGGDISFPNKPEAGMEVPGGSNVGQDGTVTAPNGDQSRPNVDGTITVPGHDNQFGTDDDGIITPNGPNKPVLNPDGTITLPDGGVIKFPGLGDCEIEILPGGHVASTGVVTNPGADGIINTADDEILDPAKVCAIEPTVTPKPTNTGVMSSVFTLLVGIVVSGVAVHTLRRRK